MHRSFTVDLQDAQLGAMRDECRLAEIVEIAAWRDLAAAAPPALRHDTRFEAVDAGGVLVLRAARLGSVLFNRAIGLGLTSPADDRQIEALLGAYRDAGIDNFWIHVSPAAHTDDLTSRMRAHGLTAFRRSWTKFTRGPGFVPAAHCELRCRSATRADAEAVAGILATAFDMPVAAGRLLAAVIGRPRWQVNVMHDAGKPVSAGALYIDGPLAYLAFAATLPAYRRRGAQGVLMRRRIASAISRGCTLITTETGTPLHAAEGNPSYQNMLRFGFRPAGVRENYGPPGSQWHRD